MDTTDKVIRAREILRELADEETNDKVHQLLEAGEAEWVADPVVDNVVGLLATGTGRTLIVAYLSLNDYEVGEAFATAGTSGNRTIVLPAADVEYDRAKAEVSIDDLLMVLTEAKEAYGATHVVLASGNYRGAAWQKLVADWTEFADEQDQG